IERALTQSWHFERCMGEPVTVRLIRPVEGVRDFVGVLSRVEGETVTILLDDEIEMTFAKKESAYIRLYADFETGGLKG
ncbi:MAG: ribosome maturation factor RimP, partial [Oscillospiraceae bacterium]|nr:ribosome maturation factor RimP [Oscillospiraceae bacterium]